MPADTKEIRDCFAFDTGEWGPIRDEGTIDMRYIGGDPWEQKDRDERVKAGRPCINADELTQYVNQVVNEVRANKRAVKFAPSGNGATDDTAQFYADKMREIEYRSRAQIGYTTAFENTVQRSYGFVRVNTRYAHSRAVNQDLWIDPVPNPNLITPDPGALMPDLSDMTRCWVREAWSIEDFNRKWSRFSLGDKSGSLMKDAPDWVKERRVFVGEYWKIQTKSRTLLIVQPTVPEPVPGRPPAKAPEPIGIFEDELQGRPVPGTVLSQRAVEDPTVVQQLTNGLEILEETTWLGKYIPIIGCFGKVLYLDESGSQRRKVLSLIRLARDPQMFFAYLVSCEAELIGMTPKFPYFLYEGQLAAAQATALAKSLHEPVPYITIKHTVEGLPVGTILPLPQRQPYEPPLQAIEFAKEAARRSIQAAMGQTPLPTAAQRRNEKSGVALKHIEEQGQRGSFHFTDHYLDMITHVGIVIEDLMDKIYDSARDVGVRRADDTADVIRINDPSTPKSVSTQGDHLVTVSTGPSYDSEREAASDFADTLAQISPDIFGLLGPLIVKLKHLGPIGDEMVELLETMQPPPVQAMRAQKAQQGDPKQAQQALLQCQAQLQQVSAMADQLKQALESKKVEQQATITKAQIDAKTAIMVQQMKDATALAVAKIQAAVKGLISANEAELEQIALAHEAEQAQIARDHEAAMAAAGAEHEGQMAQVGHDQALEQGDQAAAAQRDLQAAQPAPEPGAGA